VGREVTKVGWPPAQSVLRARQRQGPGPREFTLILEILTNS
jgi:hypothetical protein